MAIIKYTLVNGQTPSGISSGEFGNTQMTTPILE